MIVKGYYKSSIIYDIFCNRCYGLIESVGLKGINDNKQFDIYYNSKKKPKGSEIDSLIFEYLMDLDSRFKQILEMQAPLSIDMSFKHFCKGCIERNMGKNKSETLRNLLE